MEVIIKKDEWSVNDQQIARILLGERKVILNEDEIAGQQQHHKQLKLKPKHGDRLFIFVSFLIPYLSLCKLFFLSSSLIYLGTFSTGLAIGLNYRYHYQRDELGKRYFYYDSPTRFLGRLIILNAFMAVLITVLYLSTRRV
jgi:hypothetical protein